MSSDCITQVILPGQMFSVKVLLLLGVAAKGHQLSLSLRMAFKNDPIQSLWSTLEIFAEA